MSGKFWISVLLSNSNAKLKLILESLQIEKSLQLTAYENSALQRFRRYPIGLAIPQNRIMFAAMPCSPKLCGEYTRRQSLRRSPCVPTALHAADRHIDYCATAYVKRYFVTLLVYHAFIFSLK